MSLKSIRIYVLLLLCGMLTKAKAKADSTITIDSCLSYFGAQLLPDQKVVLVTNDSGSIITWTVYAWSGIDWQGNFRVVNTFDSDTTDLLLEEIWQLFNAGAWENSTRTAFAYDTSNQLLEETAYNWNGSAWENGEHSAYTYDTLGNMTLELQQSWNGSSWENFSRIAYTYDSLNNRIDITFEDWISNAWEYISRDSLDYAGKLETSKVEFNWDKSQQQWQQDRWLTKAYDANDNLTESITYKFDLTDTLYHALNRQTRTYDASDNQVEMLLFFWDTALVAWRNIAVDSNYYDLNNNLAEHVYQAVWNGTIFEEGNRELFAFDSLNNQVERLTYLKTGGGPWEPNERNERVFDSLNRYFLGVNYSWNTIDTAWQETDRCYRLYTSPPDTSKPDTNNPPDTTLQRIEVLSSTVAIQVYPNPSHGDVYIDLQTQQAAILHFKVTGIKGQEIDRWTTHVPTGRTQIPWKTGRTAPPGVYFLNVSTGKERWLYKLVIQR